MVSSASANLTALILRMEAMAESFRESADYYESNEDANVKDVMEIFDRSEDSQDIGD